jgi:hypothetical protein
MLRRLHPRPTRQSILAAFTLGAAGAVAGCGADPTSAPASRALEVHGSSAAIESLTDAPILYDQRATHNELFSRVGSLVYAADDFTVPTMWKITHIVVSGHLRYSTLPFFIAKDSPPGFPDATVASYDLAPTDVDETQPASDQTLSINDYLFTLTPPLIIPAGKYWLALKHSEIPITRVPQVVFAWQLHSPASGARGLVSSGFLTGTGWVDAYAEATDFAFVLFGSPLSEQTITFPDILPNPASAGGVATLGATSSSGLTVAYTSLSTGVCTVSGNAVSYIAGGLCEIAADQAGNADYSAATRVTKTVNVDKLAQSITFTSSPPSPASVGGTYTVSATGGGSGNSVTFSSGRPLICTVSGNTVTFIASGGCSIVANQAGNSAYEPAPEASQLIGIFKLGQSIQFTTTPPAPGYVNTTYIVGVTGGASGNPVVITAKPAEVCTASALSVTFVGLGTCTIVGTQEGNSTYNAAEPVTQSLSVEPSYRFEGFGSPLKNDGVLNVAKAGQAIPLKWRVLDLGGLPVTNLTTATITAKDLSCAADSTPDQVEEYASGGSGLQNLGDGYYQMNWKTLVSYKGSCKALTLTLGVEGGSYTVLFQFTK